MALTQQKVRYQHSHKSKWSDAEIKAKLTELGFYNNTILTLSKPKIIKKEKPKKHNSLWQKIKSKIKIN